jgi:hypothetical protein
MATEKEALAALNIEEAEKEALEALANIESVVTAPKAEAVNVVELCKQYTQIKPWLETALGLIEKIPVYGKKIAAAVRFLIQIVDFACPILMKG